MRQSWQFPQVRSRLCGVNRGIHGNGFISSLFLSVSCSFTDASFPAGQTDFSPEKKGRIGENVKFMQYISSKWPEKRSNWREATWRETTIPVKWLIIQSLQHLCQSLPVRESIDSWTTLIYVNYPLSMGPCTRSELLIGFVSYNSLMEEEKKKSILSGKGWAGPDGMPVYSALLHRVRLSGLIKETTFAAQTECQSLFSDSFTLRQDLGDESAFICIWVFLPQNELLISLLQRLGLHLQYMEI